MSSSSDLQMLLDMGFSEIRAKKALIKSGNNGIEAAMDWLGNHQEDPDIDDPIQEQQQQSQSTDSDIKQSADGGDGNEKGESSADPNAEAKSLKCDDCGKLFRSAAEAEFHASKSGHANFSQSVEEVKQLTEAEKAEQLKVLEAKLQAKRVEREAQERRDELERERKRRNEAKNLTKWRDEAADQELKREAAARRREKEEQKEYLAKIRQRYEQDRAELAAREAEEKRMLAAGTAASERPKLPQASAAAAASDSCRLQIRIPGAAQPLVSCFKANEPLANVACYVRTNCTVPGVQNGQLKFMTPFPKRVFTDEDLEKPLKVLDLCPSAVLMVSFS